MTSDAERAHLKAFKAKLARAERWPHHARLEFRNLDEQYQTLAAVLGRPIPPATIDTFFERLHEDVFFTEFESGNYGLGYTHTKFYLLIDGKLFIRTEDVDHDNCAPDGGEFELRATSAEELERGVAALVAWHEANGVNEFNRS